MDDLDFEIIRELVRDGRVTFSNLGARVGLSSHAAADRVRRLIKSGAILGLTATIDPGHLGITSTPRRPPVRTHHPTPRLMMITPKSAMNSSVVCACSTGPIFTQYMNHKPVSMKAKAKPTKTSMPRLAAPTAE
jgi:DNA-binding Lrp family transcriptional regulator